MVKINADITNRELDAMEDLIVCWNLCDTHNSLTDVSEEERFVFTQTCKKCVKINKEIRNKTLRLWSKLVTAYLKSTKKKH